MLDVAVRPLEGSPPTWCERVEWVNPGSLADHRLRREVHGPPDPDADERLVEFLRSNPSHRPIVVTGRGCASGQNVILDGHRLRDALVAACVTYVPVLRRTGLTPDAEETIIVQAALASQHTRRLRLSQIAALEERLLAIHSRGRGFRSDLTTSVGNNTSHGSTLSLVAAASGEPVNAVANRRKIFSSPVSPQILKNAVDARRMAPTEAAALVRKIEAELEVGAALTEVEGKPRAEAEQHPVLVAALDRADAKAREKLGRGKKPKRTKSPPESTKIGGVREGAVLRGEGTFRGRRITIEVEGDEIRVADAGKAPS